MSFPPAIQHLELAMQHARAGNAAKAMHHIGHAMLHLRGMTSGAGGAATLPSHLHPVGSSSRAAVKPPNGQNDTDGDDTPTTGAQGTAPAAGSLRAKLAGLNASQNGVGSSDDGGY